VGAYGYSLYVPKDLLKGKKVRNWKNVIGKVPFATMVSTGQFTTDLMNGAAQKDIDLIVDLKCNSFAMAVAALRVGTHAAIIPDIALSVEEAKKLEKISVPFLNSHKRIYYVACNSKLGELMPLSETVADAFLKSLKV
jgi:hypothetical protein